MDFRLILQNEQCVQLNLHLVSDVSLTGLVVCKHTHYPPQSSQSENIDVADATVPAPG